ncbi:unnamed protein product [Adineta ricciae]|uniref:SCP domain-containing protein n=1 Tax=Adineta ricciae TaxID=249248 RepID=A0A813Y105_ADIRI|nr:unnamed protein product [Adineta ricciae]CAF1317452.1 unnamed protein product [Adineta ricciae]
MQKQFVVSLIVLCLSAFYAVGYVVDDPDERQLKQDLRQLLRRMKSKDAAKINPIYTQFCILHVPIHFLIHDRMQKQFVVTLIALCLSALYVAGYVVDDSDERRFKQDLRKLIRQYRFQYGRRGSARFLTNKRDEEVPLSTYRQQALDKHNEYRSKHCVPSLQLDPQLNDIAQQYAEKLAATDTFAHSGNTFNGQWMGENLYMYGSSGSVLTGTGDAPVTSWYNEIADYNWNKPGFSMATGHFTQLIWKATTNVGIGRAVSNSNQLYVVANYFPGGNMEGDFEANVPPLC